MTAGTIRKGIGGLLPAAALLFAAACDDSTGPGAERLRPEDVSAIYNVCQLAFDPNGTTLPTVDIRAAAFEVGAANGDPQIALDVNPQIFELTYVPKGQLTDRELHGTYSTRSLSQVDLRFTGSGVSPRPLLIPEDRTLPFEYQESPLALTLASSMQYNVTRADYVALSGSDPAGLADQIPGVLVARFQVDDC